MRRVSLYGTRKAVNTHVNTGGTLRPSGPKNEPITQEQSDDVFAINAAGHFEGCNRQNVVNAEHIDKIVSRFSIAVTRTNTIRFISGRTIVVTKRLRRRSNPTGTWSAARAPRLH